MRDSYPLSTSPPQARFASLVLQREVVSHLQRGKPVSLMPARGRNFCRVRLVWLFRAGGVPCVPWGDLGLRSAPATPWAATGSTTRTGSTPPLRCGSGTPSTPDFFPPKLLSHSRQKQVAHATQDQVAFQALGMPALVLVRTDLGLLVLETASDSATARTPPRSIVWTDVPTGALLTKNFNSAGFSTSRATIRCNGSPGRPFVRPRERTAGA